MSLISVQEYSSRYKVSKQSVYARIKSGSIQVVVKDGIKMIQDNSQDVVNAESTNSQDNSQPAVNAESIEITYLKKEIKRLKKELKKKEKKEEKLENKIDKLENRNDKLFEIMFIKKDINAITTGEIVDVAIEKKKKKKNKKR